MIGLAGMLLPPMLVIGGWVACPRVAPQRSMSAYYYTDMRDLFVLVLFALGVFLVCYCRHYDDRGLPVDDPQQDGVGRWAGRERLVSTWAGVLAICVAVFPTLPKEEAPISDWMGVAGIHIVSAVFFLSLTGWIAYRYFPMSDPSPKHKRLYKGLGWTIWVAVLLAIVLGFLKQATTIPSLLADHGVLIAECLAVFAFGIAWFVNSRDALSTNSTDTRNGTPPAAEDGE